ncbi:hypothetical protein KTAU_28570 [Thermogemmatispora aurantia]|jgi:hypothetical protein|nr:hypothetical protein KTAU_28570 [Thermogemmatispora aurantia]
MGLSRSGWAGPGWMVLDCIAGRNGRKPGAPPAPLRDVARLTKGALDFLSPLLYVAGREMTQPYSAMSGMEEKRRQTASRAGGENIELAQDANDIVSLFVG